MREEGDYYTYRNTVTTRMTTALRRAVMRGVWGGGGEGDYIPIATLSPPE